jgi:dethiobiotin synthetase
MLRLFVTGTDTGVGKTRTATGLCLAFAAAGKRVAAMKPVASGSTPTRAGLRSADALQLQRAMNIRASYAEVNPYAYEPAVAPHIAALEAGHPIDFEVLDRCFERLSLRSEVTIIEGAGGWLAPLDATRTFADLATRWQLDIILVVGLRLGCLNHALLTAESVARHGLRLKAWVANSIDPSFERRAENLAALRARLAAPCIGVLDFVPEAAAADIAQALSANLAALD